MNPPAPDPATRRMSPKAWRRLLLASLLVLGVLPFAPILGWLPWGSDAAKWVSWTSLHNPHWWLDVTWRKHFVGYRPVAAFSYVLNHVITGHEPWGYRGFDLLLHTSTGGLWVATVRQWTRDPDDATSGVIWSDALLALVPLVVLFGHPAIEEVVPYSARRSYLLSLSCGLGALWLFGASLSWTRWASVWFGTLGSAGLLGLAILSNESAYVLVPLVPLVGLHLAWGERRFTAIVVRFLPSLAVTIGAIALRMAVLGSLSGGYYKMYFAYIRPNGRPGWRELPSWQPFRILEAAFSYLVHPNAVNGFWVPGQRWIDLLVVIGALIFVVGLAVVRPVLQRHDRVARAAGLAALWMLGSIGIVVMSRTWFWRQAYWLLPPYGLLLGIALRQAWLALQSAPRTAAAFGLPAAGLGLLALVHGPLLHAGMNTGIHRDRSRGTQAALAVRRQARELADDTDVMMVLPLGPARAHLVRIWQGRFFAGTGLRFRLLAHLDRGAEADQVSIRVESDPDRFVLTGGYWLVDSFRKIATTEPSPASIGSHPRQELPFDRLHHPRRPLAVVAIQGPAPLTVRMAPRRASTAPNPSPSHR